VGGFKVAIPARYASTRLPGKPLLELAGRPMIQHVHQRAVESGAGEVVVATDDERIATVAEGFGATVCMTSPDHPTGTDRLAEVVEKMGWEDGAIVVNLQGDEPLMPLELIRQVAGDLERHPDAGIATLAAPIHTSAELFDPHVVKVVCDRDGYALYFSRAPIPWDRDAFGGADEELPPQAVHFRHLGMYAYRAGFLKHYREMEHCAPERLESLEQLRALWHGVRIHVSEAVATPGHGVDTPDDLERVARLLAQTT